MRLTRDSLIVLGIVAAITVTYVVVVYRRQSSTLEAVGGEAAECRRQLEGDLVKTAPIPHMARDIETMKRRFDKDWQRRLPQRQELAGFLREISTHLSEAGLRSDATVIEPGRPTRGTLYNRLPITMKFEGDFLSLASFLKRVDDMTRLTRIEKLRIVPDADGDLLKIEVGMNIYFTEQ